MLAAKATLEDVKFPCLVSAKIDGIRCIITPEGPMTRNGKPIPNDYVRNILAKLPIGLDGELVVGRPCAKDVFRVTSSAIRSKKGMPDFKFCVFDKIMEAPYRTREQVVRENCHVANSYHVSVIHQSYGDNIEKLRELEQCYLEAGYEGICTRSLDGKYKNGRSTLKEQGLLKIKYFVDDFTVITGVEKAVSETKQDQVGKFQCLFNGIEFEIGMFEASEKQKIEMWENREKLLGKVIKFKYFPVGAYEAPRHAVFLGFSDEML